MSVEPEIRQRLLELVYDLLTDEEAAELRARIEADPDLAQAYAEARETAGLLGEAARIEAPRIAVSRPEKPVAVPFVRPEPAPAAPRPAALRADAGRRAPWARWANWTVGVVAGALLLVSITGYFYQRSQLSGLAAEHMRLQVVAPPRLLAGTSNQVEVAATTVTGEPLAAQIEFALYAPDGRELMGHHEKTDEHGRLSIAIPAEKVPAGAPQVRLAVRGVRKEGQKEQEESFEGRLAVEPVRYVTQLALDKPLYRPGEKVRYRSLTLSRSGLVADRQAPVRFEVLDPRGAVVAGSELEGLTDKGVGCGEFLIGPEMAGGQYTLAAKALDGAFPEERRKFFVRAYRLPRLKKELEFARDSYGPGEKVVADFSAVRAEGGPAADARLRVVATVDGKTAYEGNAQASPVGTFQIEFKLPEKIERGDGQLVVVADDGGASETLAKTIPINLGKVDVAFFPEGGDLVAGLENRVYFSARDPLGKPVHVAGKVVDSQGRTAAVVETKHEGMGTFQIEPVLGEQYRLRLDSPAGAKDEPKLPPPASGNAVVLSTGLGVFDADKPLEFVVRAKEPGVPLVAAAWCRGAPVGQQAFVTQTQGSEKETFANPVQVPLSAGVGGVVRLTVYDYSAAPPKPVAERLVYRRPARRLNVQVDAGGKRAPGEKVELALRVTDETGKPSPAVLGVAVADDALLNLAEDRAAAMATHFLLATEVRKPEDLEKIDFYLSEDPKAPAALDLLLGTQGWRRFVERTLDELRREGRSDEDIARLAALGGPAEPPALFDNLAELKTRYRQSLEAYRTERTHLLNMLITLTLLGGLGLVLFVGMLSLMNIPCGARLWTPAIGVATVCLLVGMVLLNPEGWGGQAREVAFAPFQPELPPLARVETRQTAKKGAAEKEAWRWDKAEKLMEDLAGPVPAEMAMPDAAADMPRDLAAMAAAAPAPEAPAMPMRLRPPAARAMAAEVGDRKFDAFMELEEAKAMAGGGRGEQLRRRMAGRDLKKAKADEAGLRFVVPVYAHQRRPASPGVRTDFTETLYWHPMLLADGEGRARATFDLSDSVTTFRVQVDAHGEGGRIGSGRGEVVSRIPFSLEPTLPLEVTAGDRIDLPLAVVNDTDRKLPVRVALACGPLVRLEGPADRQLELPAGARGREFFALEVTGEKGDGELAFRGTTDRLADAIRRPLKIVPPGFPKSLSFAGQIEGKQEVVVRLPDRWAPGSLEVGLAVFPSTVANLQKGMEGMLQEPNGCFEQASSSNYPNVMTLQYLQEHNVADPAVTRRARELLKSGYGKLAAYESPAKGYEWFGGDPGHEALTAYGLLEFRDMARVHDVDPAMVRRTAQWLMDRRDGKGGFQRNPRALDSFGAAPPEITDAYITWALAESGQKGIETEVKHALALAEKSDDPYLVALAAGAAVTADQRAGGRKLLEKLAKAQADDGHLEGASGSITRSGGLSLRMETTALAALAWMKLPEFTAQANRAVEWLTRNRQGGGGFGSTQATILALKALTEHSKANRRAVAGGKLVVHRAQTLLGETPFAAGRQETISVAGLEAKLQAGENRLTLELTGGNKLPYTLNVSYRTSKPADDEACPLRLAARLASGKVRSGETVALEADLTNLKDAGQPMAVAVVGLPAGLEVRPDQLEDLKKAGTIDAYETRAREVIFYWRSLAPKKKTAWKLDLVAAVPGRYTGPASRAYLYYTAEQKHWAEPLAVEIVRK